MGETLLDRTHLELHPARQLLVRKHRRERSEVAAGDVEALQRCALRELLREVAERGQVPRADRLEVLPPAALDEHELPVQKLRAVDVERLEAGKSRDVDLWSY